MRERTTTPRAWRRLALGAALALHALAHAAGAPAIEHRVQPGDTLLGLSAHYLGDARLWPQLQRVNGVADPRRLRPGAVLRIPLDLLPHGTAEVAFVEGQARLEPPGAAPSQALRPGQRLPEGARVQAGPASFVSVRLADGTVVRIQADSDVLIEQLRRRGRAGDAQTLLQLRRGSVEPSVPPAQPHSQRRLEIYTPSASTAVRGTRYVVALAADGRTLAAVEDGTVAVGPPGAAPVQDGATVVTAGQGVAVTARGQVGTPQALLPAPAWADLPAVAENADFLDIALTPVAGAVAYQVQMARDAAFTAIVRSATSATPTVRLPTPDDGAYHVAARAIDAEGLPGRLAQQAITVKARPQPPLAQSPAAGGTLARQQGALVCTPVAGVARYRIQVAGDAGFAAPLLDATRTGECTLPVAALPPGAYQWRAASVGETPGGGPDQGPFSPARPFAVAEQPTAPGGEAIVAREDGARVRLAWPGRPGERFRLQLAHTQDFATPVLDEELAQPAWAAPALPPGPYFVRIRTHDPSGLHSAFSTPRQIQVPPPVRSGAGLAVTASDGQPLATP